MQYLQLIFTYINKYTYILNIILKYYLLLISNQIYFILSGNPKKKYRKLSEDSKNNQDNYNRDSREKTKEIDMANAERRTLVEGFI